jgi:FlaA1/EpsC-like NDP-sugar epimerase
VFAVAYAASYLLRFAGEPAIRFLPILEQTVGVAVLVKLAVAWWFRIDQGWGHYVTFHDVLILVQTVTCASIGITLVDALLLAHVVIPRSVILLDWGCTLMVMGGLWAVPRLVRDGGWRFFAPIQGTPALIVGANDSGEALLRSLRRTPTLNYHAVGFVDDRPEVAGCRIGGVPVVGTTTQIAFLAEKYGIDEVLMTAGELNGKQVRELVDRGRDRNFRVTVLPSYEQLLQGHVEVQPRPVCIEDLLGRPSVQLDLDQIRIWLERKTLLVTGSAGSIGAEICRQLAKLSPARLILVDRAETGQFFAERELRQLAPQLKIETVIADITDYARMDAVLGQHRPDIIFHAAAYKHVPLMESHPGEAVKNIVLATRSLVDLAEAHGASGFVMISTDKAVNPTSVMGACKRLAEQYVQAKSENARCRMVTVRFGNVLDSAGSVVPIFRAQIAHGGPVTVTHPDMIRYFMLIPEAAQLVIQAGAMGQGGEIFVLDMGEPVRIVDLAHDMIRLSGLRVGEDIEIEYTGLRPGEKLFEELYGDGEAHLRTTHAKIMVATGQRRKLLAVINDLRRLEETVDGPRDIVCSTLHELISDPAKSASSIRSAA